MAGRPRHPRFHLELRAGFTLNARDEEQAADRAGRLIAEVERRLRPLARGNRAPGRAQFTGAEVDALLVTEMGE